MSETSHEGGAAAGVNEYARMAEEQYDLPLDRYRQTAISALESLEDEQIESGETEGTDETDAADAEETEPEAEPQA